LPVNTLWGKCKRVLTRLEVSRTLWSVEARGKGGRDGRNRAREAEG
jgi:hypothetical protein